MPAAALKGFPISFPLGLVIPPLAPPAEAFVTVQAYAISANLASIPIFSILMRYNLIESKLMGPKAGCCFSLRL